ncbi:hypothetical protein [Streptomyces sp. NPDC019224]|uniref:hypothetical protein n=1 Tax=Streptomyces sp. NPDC019224 TaxID=3154484 RepID=UPI0033E62F80
MTLSAAPSCAPTPPSAAAWWRSATTSSTGSHEAEKEGWLGEIEGLRVSLAGAESRIDQIDSAPGSVAINLGMSRKAPAHPVQKEGAGSLRQSRDDQQ